MTGRLKLLPLLLLPLLLVLGCVPEEPREAGPFVDHERWELADDDPWPDHAPDPVDCSELAWSYETQGGEASLEVRTDDCNYLVVRQDSVRAAQAGDELQFRLWHFDLIQFEPAVAHVGVRLDGETVFDVEVDIPGDAEMIRQELLLDRDVPAGAPVIFHLHNHGANTWNMVEMSVNPPETLED
jgi:hypothetical protein